MRLRVLLAEDDAVLREALAELIASEPDFELVALAEDADQTIARAIEHQPDVAVLDVRMPGGGGVRAAEGIAEAGLSTRVLAHSAYGDRETVFRMLAAGATSYVVKGSPPSDLLDAIRAAARGSSLLSAEVATGVVSELVPHLARAARSRDLDMQRTARVRAVLDGGGPEVVYQPIFDLRSNTVAGAEALSRFEFPARPPEEWFMEAEAVGLLLELELSALRRALKEAAQLPPRIFLSVNLSPRTLLSEQLLDVLRGGGSRAVVLELTEHQPVDDYAGLGAALKRLGQAGVRLAIDDAGAGYASLKHILRLRPSFIKLDVSLTRDIESELGQQALAVALIAFANKIGAAIVAEGIESSAQLGVLRELGVSHGQGYLLGWPEPVGKLSAWARARTRP